MGELTARKYLESKGLSDHDYMDSGMIDHISGIMEEFRQYRVTSRVILPSVDDAAIIAVNVASNVRPKLTAQEEAMFIAGFQECVKYLSEQMKNKTPNTI
jgi:hypothetical protein